MRPARVSAVGDTSAPWWTLRLPAKAVLVGSMRHLVRTGVATVFAAGWLVISVGFALALGLMSIDEEWEGWSDALPLVLLYLVFTAAVWIVVWILVRTHRNS